MSRKFPHSLTLRPGVVFPTAWHSTNSVHYETCPRCGAEPGFLCVTPTGRRAHGLTGGAHGERQAAFGGHHPELAALSVVEPIDVEHHPKMYAVSVETRCTSCDKLLTTKDGRLHGCHFDSALPTKPMTLWVTYAWCEECYATAKACDCMDCAINGEATH